MDQVTSDRLTRIFGVRPPQFARRRWLLLSAAIVLVVFGREMLSAAALGLVPPVAVVEAGMFLDGGTTFLVLRDVLGREYSLCREGRLDAPRDLMGRYYAGAGYPTAAGAQRLRATSVQAAAARVLAKVWLNRTFNRTELRALLRDEHYERREPREVAAHELMTAWQVAPN